VRVSRVRHGYWVRSECASYCFDAVAEQLVLVKVMIHVVCSRLALGQHLTCPFGLRVECMLQWPRICLWWRYAVSPSVAA
jgi:hypothetical protein